MDLLGSIMKKMEKPPALDEKERQRLKQQRELAQKQRDEDQKRWKEFRQKVHNKMESFKENIELGKIALDPMTKFQRSIVHDMAESAGLVAISFGEEEVDRHVVLYKPETAPSETEISAIKRGVPYDPTHGHDQKNEQSDKEVTEQQKPRNKKQPQQKPDYLQKYEKHFGGLDVSKAAAKSTETNRSYGFVSSESKKDKRTIEETLADIRAKKKQRTEEKDD